MDPIRLIGPAPPPIRPVVPAGPRRDGEQRARDEEEARRRQGRQGEQGYDVPGGPDADGHVDVLA